jgi:hypothetical protein
MVIKDDQITLAAYTLKLSLLNEPGWKKLKTLARRLLHDKQGVNHLHYNVMVNKHTKGPVYQFGIQVPHNVKDAYKLDKKNGNTNQLRNHVWILTQGIFYSNGRKGPSGA